MDVTPAQIGINTVFKMIDTHTHLYSEEFDNDRTEVIEKALSEGIEQLLLPNIDLTSVTGMNQLVEKYPGKCFAMMGLHPCSVDEKYKTVLDQMYKELTSNKSNYIAVGEIGMDLYWDQTFEKEQKEAFKIQTDWAKSLHLPIAIHVRNAWDELFELLDEVNNQHLKGVFHCFTGNQEQAEKALSYGGFKLGLGGVLTFKNSGLDKVIENIDMEHLILETDAPYLAPTPYRGKRNESAYVIKVAEKLADIKSISLKEVDQITTKNAKRLFNI